MGKLPDALSYPRRLPAGEAAVVVELGNAIDPDLNARVRALDRELANHPFEGFTEAVPTYRSLLVFYEPLETDFDRVSEHCLALVRRASQLELAPQPVKEVPAVYDGEDLDDVSRQTGLSRDEVIRQHCETEYLVYMVGFTPGFAYMGLTPDALDIPRRSSPRTRVPAGSVAIAMAQTGIYPSPTPGGWSLLGRAEHRRLFDIDADPPSFFVAGDRVRFVPVAKLPPFAARAEPMHAATGEPVFEVEEGGLLSTVQDLGRSGLQRYGVPVAGAMDGPWLRIANRLTGNAPGAAGLECTVSGPRLRCLRPVVVAVTGADLGAVVERDDLGSWRPPLGSSFFLRTGNVLRFDGQRQGARAYIAVGGGIDVPVVAGSRSTYLTAALGGYRGRSLARGDRLYAGPTAGPAHPGKRWPEPSELDGEEPTIRFVWGPQDDYFTEDGKKTFVTSRYRVAPSSDRMGYRLEGPALEHAGAKEIISDGMMLGGIQVPPNGLPIVMLADRATTGGYPKIGTVIRVDIARLGQLLPGDALRFEAVNLEEARGILRRVTQAELSARPI